MITQIPTASKEIKAWKITFRLFGSNVYLLKINRENILIDTSSYENRDELISDLESLDIKPSDINIILLTHNHWDHIQNLDLFKNSNLSINVYGSKEDFKNEEFPGIKDIKQIESVFPELKIIETPGHTPGCICIYLEKERILFSGDTLFHKGVGRTDFPESSPKKMRESLDKLDNIDYKTLCPGHDI